MGSTGLLTAVAVLVSIASLVLLVSDQPPGEGSAEAGFARDMSVHHAQAVEMAQIARENTQDPEIINLASDMAITQQGQIGRMQGWLSVWRLPISGSGERMKWMGHEVDGQMPGMASPEKLNELRNAEGKGSDELFLKLMIPHHKAAVPMSEAIMERSDDEAVTSLAESIAAAQSSEIEVMRDMREERGFEPVNGEGGSDGEPGGMDHGSMDHD